MANIMYVSKFTMDSDQEEFLFRSALDLGALKKAPSLGDLNITHILPDEWKFTEPDVSEGEVIAFNYDIDPDLARNTVFSYTSKGATLMYPMNLTLSDRNIDDDDPIWLVDTWQVVQCNKEEMEELLNSIKDF